MIGSHIPFFWGDISLGSHWDIYQALTVFFRRFGMLGDESPWLSRSQGTVPSVCDQCCLMQEVCDCENLPGEGPLGHGEIGYPGYL